jgi:hypothetical protein
MASAVFTGFCYISQGIGLNYFAQGDDYSYLVGYPLYGLAMIMA